MFLTHHNSIGRCKMKVFDMRTRMVSALLVAFSGLAGSGALAEEPTSSTIIAPVLGQLVGFTLPSGFTPRKAQTDGGRYFRAAVMKNETVSNWSQLISITGVNDFDRDPKKT